MEKTSLYIFIFCFFNHLFFFVSKILQEGYQEIPTKSKGRPKKNSIPSYAELQKLQNEKQLISAPCTSDNESISHSEEFIDIEQ
jgi:hypothetical protein